MLKFEKPKHKISIVSEVKKNRRIVKQILFCHKIIILGILALSSEDSKVFPSLLAARRKLFAGHTASAMGHCPCLTLD